MLDLSIDNFENSVLMAEQIIKRKAEQKKKKELEQARDARLARCKKHSSAATPPTSSSRSDKSTCSSSKFGGSKASKKASSTDKTKATRKNTSSSMRKTILGGSRKEGRGPVSIRMETSDEQSVVSAISCDSGGLMTNVSGHMSNLSGHMSNLSARSEHSGNMSFSSAHNSQAPVFRQSVIVDKTWEKIKTMDGYEEALGEQIVLRMMEMDPTCRKALNITSLRSMRFDEVCHTLVVIVDLIVSLVGPDLDDFEDELVKIGKQCKSEGIKISLLAEAVSEAVNLTLGMGTELSEQDVQAWKAVIGFVAQKMEAPAKQEEEDDGAIN